MIPSSASVGPDNCCCSSVEYLNLLFYTKIERNLFLNCCMISNLCLWLFQYYFMTERTLAEINPGDEDFGKRFVAWLFSQPAVAWESQMVEEHSLGLEKSMCLLWNESWFGFVLFIPLWYEWKNEEGVAEKSLPGFVFVWPGRSAITEGILRCRSEWWPKWERWKSLGKSNPIAKCYW